MSGVQGAAPNRRQACRPAILVARALKESVKSAPVYDTAESWIHELNRILVGTADAPAIERAAALVTTV